MTNDMKDEMTTDPTFEENKQRAIRNLASLDDADGYKDRQLRTILFALEAGLRNPESNAQFDALVMLEDLVSSSPSYPWRR
jgi:hypothetical protein